MDRGRVGLDVVGNRSIREAALRKRRREHLDRLKKIRQRQPGDSPTLDNVLSEDLLGFQNNRRAIAEAAKGEVVERENKALLQRISKILTAPSKLNSEEDYWKMKKLFVRMNASEKYEKALLEKKQAEIFERIHSTGAYYNHKIWEEDYQRQLKGQKFMRQVRYKRPKDFVDPYAPASGDEKDGDDGSGHGGSRSRSRSKDKKDHGHPDDGVEDEDYNQEDFDRTGDTKDESLHRSSDDVRNSSAAKSDSRGGKNSHSSAKSPSDHKVQHKGTSSSKHVNRIRNLSQDGGNATPKDSNTTHSKKKGSQASLRPSGSQGSKKQISLARASSYAEMTSTRDTDETNETIDVFAPRLLAHVHRNLKIVDGDDDNAKSNAPVKRVLTDVQCWSKGVPSNQIRKKERSRSYSTVALMDYSFAGPDSSKTAGVETNVSVQIITLSAELLEGNESLSCSVWLDLKKLVDAWIFDKGVEDTWGATATELGAIYSSSSNDSTAGASLTTSATTSTETGNQRRENIQRQNALLQEMAKDIISNISLLRTETLLPTGSVVALQFVLPEYVNTAELTRIDVGSRTDASGAGKGEKSYRSGADFRKQSIFENLDEQSEECVGEGDSQYRDDAESSNRVFKCGVRVPFEVNVAAVNVSITTASGGQGGAYTSHPPHMQTMPVLQPKPASPHHHLGAAGHASSTSAMAGGGISGSNAGGSTYADAGAIHNPSANRKASTFPPLLPVKESIYVLMKMENVADEKVQITVYLLDNFSSVQLRHNGKRTTLSAGSVYSCSVPLPTIMAIDHELVNEFFANLKDNFRLVYDRSQAVASLCLKEGDDVV